MQSADDVELSGWTVSGVDAFTAHEVFAPIGARDFLLVRLNFPLGLSGVNAVHLFSGFGVLVDGFAWTTPPATSFGRCPDGAGDFATTTAASFGSSNLCP